ncbi:hypothetical protein AAKU61_004083 [Undibacterium sp. GrIS 1.2]
MPCHQLHEVFYDKEEQPNSYRENPMNIFRLVEFTALNGYSRRWQRH